MTGTELLSAPRWRAEDAETARPGRQFDPNRWWARAFGGMFLAGGLAHLLLLSLSSGAYDRFADASYWSFIRHAWRSVLVPNVYYLVSVLAVFELVVGALILGRRHRRLGMAAGAAFNAALALFGWGFLLWSLPVLALLGRSAAREVRPPGAAGGGAT